MENILYRWNISYTIQMEITQCKWKILNTNSNYETSSIHIKFYAIKTECNIIQYDTIR